MGRCCTLLIARATLFEALLVLLSLSGLAQAPVKAIIQGTDVATGPNELLAGVRITKSSRGRQCRPAPTRIWSSWPATRRAASPSAFDPVPPRMCACRLCVIELPVAGRRSHSFGVAIAFAALT